MTQERETIPQKIASIIASVAMLMTFIWAANTVFCTIARNQENAKKAIITPIKNSHNIKYENRNKTDY